MAQLNLLQMSESGARAPFGHFGAHMTLEDISNTPLKLEFIAENYENYIMIALEGQKFVRIGPDYQQETRENAQDILFL